MSIKRAPYKGLSLPEGEIYLTIHPCFTAICYGNKPAAKLLSALLFRWNPGLDVDMEQVESFRIQVSQESLLEAMCDECVAKTLHEAAIPCLYLFGYLDVDETTYPMTYTVYMHRVRAMLDTYKTLRKKYPAYREKKSSDNLRLYEELEKSLIVCATPVFPGLNKRNFQDAIEKSLIGIRENSNSIREISNSQGKISNSPRGRKPRNGAVRARKKRPTKNNNNTNNLEEQEKEHVRETPIEAIASPSLDTHDDVCNIEQWIEDVCSRRDERVPLPVGDVFHDDAPVTEPTLLTAPVAPPPSLFPIANEKTSDSEQKQAKQEKVVSLTLSLPTDEWTPQAILQVFESHHGRRYPNGAKRKSDRIRDKELESCVTLHSMTDLWKGTTEEKSAYLLRLIVHQETRHENWWLDHNGHVLPHQFVEKDRIHTMADELDRLNKKAQFSVVSKTPQTDTQVQLSKLSEGFRILSPLELAQLPMDEKRAYHHAYNDYLRTQQGLPSQAARA